MSISLFSNVINEFKTRKAAVKFCHKVIQNTKVIEVKQSYYGFELNSKGFIYQVILT